MAFGFFRGSFEIEAAEAVLSSVLTEQNATGKLAGRSSYSLMSSSLNGSPGATTSTPSSSISTYFPADAYAKSNRGRSRDDDTSSVGSLGSQLSNMDGFGFDNDGAMTNDSYNLLDLESGEETKAREVSVPSASVALELLHQWSLVEFDSKTNRYRMHNLVQLFAEEEAGRMGEECFANPVTAPTSSSSPSSFVAASLGAPSMSIPLGKELFLTWKRRFVRYYCMIVAKASHAYRFEGTLALFDKERANIESAMRLAHELTLQSIEQVRESNCRVQQESVSEQVGIMPINSLSTMRSNSEPAFFADDETLPKPAIERHNSSFTACSSNTNTSDGAGSGRRSATLNNSSIVDALLYSNLVVRCRFIFRARVEPRRRIQVVSSCLQLSRETRSLHCTCGNRENDPATLLWDVEEAKFDRELSLLDKLPSFEEPQPPVTAAAAHDRCTCIGIRELIALEALLLTDLGYACCDVTDWVAGEYHYLESLRLQREVLGWSEHPQVAEVLNQFGICLSTRWGYLAHNVWLLQHAERLLKGALEMRSRVLSKNHPEYATSLNNLANFYKNYPTAGKRRSPSSALREDAHESRKRNAREGKSGGRRGGNAHRGALSNSSPSPSRSSTSSESRTSPSRASVVTEGIRGVMDASGDEGARPDIVGMYRQSLKIREMTLGENHPQVAQSLNNLALYLSSQLETQPLRYVGGSQLHEYSRTV
ncbi:unnamed protein product [Phytophthora fragariaefolia]|uniref:Unnamed protein product n=1 Tax=Phytophthora fragariaefolia TaxID=1490495 RepID=A0A9W6U7B5_9STRA|nr:unnamed protein product [Phytophthora fragariaefolia]